jgi:hypothetical protein
MLPQGRSMIFQLFAPDTGASGTPTACRFLVASLGGARLGHDL